MPRVLTLPVFSHEELADICKNADLAKARNSGLATYREPFTDALVGREFSCRFDNATHLVLRFESLHTLYWSENKSPFREEYYEALISSAGNIVGVHFFRRHVLPFEGAFLAIDMDTGFITWAAMPIGKDSDDKDVLPFPYFGEIEGVGSHQGERHHFSSEFVGTIIDWKYNDTFTIRHAYITPDTTICPALPGDYADEEEFVHRLFLPAFQVKIRDNLLLTSFVEPGGCAAVLLIDLKTVHDIGCFYGIGGDGGFSSVTIAAIGGIGEPGLRKEDGYAKPLLEK